MILKRNILILTFCLSSCAVPFLTSERSNVSGVPPEGRRLALLVGISDYDKGTNPQDKWGPLNTGKDLENMRYVLERYYGFEKSAVRNLVNDEATKDNVISVFNQHLISNAKPGDRIVFYYTGHGFHLPDASGDETADHEDEVTVMWLPKEKQNLPATERRAAMYMLDDTYQDLLIKLSNKMRGEDGKARGSVTVIFDSCNSGSAAKGPLTPKGREWDEAIDGPRPAPFVPSGVASGWLTLGKDQFENVAFIAASQSDQLSYMMPDSETDGSILTYYLAEYLINIARNKPHRGVSYDDMLQSISPKVRATGRAQDPQIEGNIFAGILGDGEPLVFERLPTVRQVQTGPLRLELGMGSLHALTVGSRFDIFRQNTDVKNPANKLGELQITAVKSITSEGKVVNPSPGAKPADYEAAQAVLTQQQFDGAPLKVLVPAKLSPTSPPIPEPRIKALSAMIAKEPFISTTGVTDENFDVMLGWCGDDKGDKCKDRKDKFFYQRASGKILPLGATIDAELLKKLLLAEWRWRRFAALTLSGFPKVHVNIVGKNGEPLLRSEGGKITLRPGDEGKVTVTNNTGMPVFITLLYLKDSGDIVVFPGEREVNGQQSVPGDNMPHDLFTFDDIAAKQVEVEILKIIATPRPADFTGVSMSAEDRKGIKNKGPENPLEELLFGMMDATPKSFNLKPIQLDLWYTDQVVYEIRPN